MSVRPGSITWAGVALAGILAGLALPRLLRTGRLAAGSLGGMTFISGSAGGPRPNAEPAKGRPA